MALYQNCSNGFAPLNWLPELKIEKKNIWTTSPRRVARFQNKFTEMLLVWPFTKLLKAFRSAEQIADKSEKKKKKKKKKLNDIAKVSGPISKQFHRNVPLMALYQNFKNGFARLTKIASRAKNKKNNNNKNNNFRRHRLGQWPDFKIILQRCSAYCPLPKLLKWPPELK